MVEIRYKRPTLDTEYDFVAVLDALPPDERVAFALTANVTDMLDSEGIPWRRYDCGNRLGALTALEDLASCAEQGGKFPIHFVGHGSSIGVGVGKQFLSWFELSEKLVAINAAMSGELILNMTSCRGLHGIKAVSLKTTADPFFGILGPVKDLSVADARTINRQFYLSWFQGTDISKIVEDINQQFGRDVLFCASAEGFRVIKGVRKRGK